MKKYNTALIMLIFLIIGIGFLMRPIFKGSYILSQTFSVSIFTMHYYGACMALALLVGWYISRQRSVIYGFSKEFVDDMFFWVSLLGFVGARVYHVLSSLKYYWYHPFESLAVWNGGLSIYGAVIGGFAGLVIYKKISKSSFSILDALNLFTPGLILGQVIGRFGNFFNYELYGYPTQLPWKMFVPIEFRNEQFSIFTYFHPLFLYEAIGNLVVFCILYRISYIKKGGGHLFLWYVLLYNVLRFGLEFMRIDSVFIGHVRQNAVVSMVCIVCAMYMLVRKNHV